MIFQWLLISINVIFILYLLVLVFYYRNLTSKETNNTTAMQYTIEEAELVIRKYQLQLHKSIGNIGILNEELENARTELKQLKNRYNIVRKDNDERKLKVLKLESKLDALA